MLSFESDYTTGCLPEILQRLTTTNMEAQPGYGSDAYTQSAKEKIGKECNVSADAIEFLAGGTQTNALVIASLLKDYEGAVAATTGHIEAHEAGALEYTGHKILTIPGHDGKIDASELSHFLETFYADDNHEHMVFPGLVYVSHPTEYGTLYTQSELQAIADICHRYKMPLFLDGARLAYGLAAHDTDLTLPEIAKIVDVFYIGGTKCGAICGEAIVFTKNNKPPHFLNFIKKRGALLAKGRLIGIQFDTLFTNGLYESIGKHAIAMANQMVRILKEAGIPFFKQTSTNQQFVILENEQMKKLAAQVRFGYWEPYDSTHTVVRFATSWSTTDSDLDQLKQILHS